MGQINWVYLDNCGGRHRVGLFHGDRTGHLLIHCNMKVVQIDFSVLETKTYSFFIEDELCEVIAEKMQNGRFGYEFRVNKTIDTPRNRIRRVDNRRNNRLLALFIVGVVIVIAGFVFALTSYGKREDMRRMSKTSIAHNLGKSNQRKLMETGRSSVSTLHVEAINAKRIGVYTFKTADSIEIRGVFEVADTGMILLQNGFPLRNGDSFDTYYLPSDPQAHRVELFQPTKATVTRYIAHALAVEEHSSGDSRGKSLCRVLTVAELLQWPALADFIFQDKTAVENPAHNKETYLRLVRGGEVEKAVAAGCWDK